MAGVNDYLDSLIGPAIVQVDGATVTSPERRRKYLNLLGGYAADNPTNDSLDVGFGTPGGVSIVPPPVAAGWTLVNASGATLVDGGRNDLLYSANSSGSTSNDRRLAWSPLAYPTPPFTFTVGYYRAPLVAQNSATILVGDTGANFIEFGIFWNSSNNGRLQVQKFSSPTSSSGFYNDDSAPPLLPSTLLYWHLHDDGTNLTWAVSQDGFYANAAVFEQRARTDFLTPARLGIGIDPCNSDSLRGNVRVHVFHLAIGS